MSYQTTIGWSLVSSGIVTLLIDFFPGDSFYWGIAFLVLGVIIMSRRLL